MQSVFVRACVHMSQCEREGTHTAWLVLVRDRENKTELTLNLQAHGSEREEDLRRREIGIDLSLFDSMLESALNDT